MTAKNDRTDGESGCEYAGQDRQPAEAASSDPEILRAALIREAGERRRAECLAGMQAEIVQLALHQLVRQPDIEGFFGALTRAMVEESESFSCGVWLVDDAAGRCEFWMAYVKDELFTARQAAAGLRPRVCQGGTLFPCAIMANHLFEHRDGWTETLEYSPDDPRLPQEIRDFQRRNALDATVATPLVIGDITLGWMTVTSDKPLEPQHSWWRIQLIEAIARQAALALHHSRLVDRNLAEERRKAILEERNRLARDIHDNLAQGFAAILMQLQGARRELSLFSPGAAASVETAIELARTHLSEARRSVGALRPNTGSGEDVASAIKRLAALAQRTTGVPIDVLIDELPRAGEGVEREIVSIAQEALTNAVRHSQAARIKVRASAVRSLGLRISIADDGRGIARERAASGFGMTSMQERADKIGASLTIVTAPRNGTEVVLAWEPTSLPTQVHVAH